MKDSPLLIFKNIKIISLKEKKAYQTKFGRKLNVIRGGNFAGKSSLIKCLYYAFGAEIKMSRKWKSTNFIIVLEFRINDEDLIIYRERNTIAVFDKNEVLLKVFENAPLEISEYFSRKFNYLIKLPDSNYNLVIPPLSYLFLPYYVDQDNGWSKNWNSIKRTIVRNGKQEMIPYHAGIKVNKEFVLQNEIRLIRANILDLNREVKVIRSIIKKTEVELKSVDLNIDIEQFRSEVDKLLKHSNTLNNERQDYVNKISEYQTDKLHIIEQIKISEKAVSEINKDINYLQGLDEGPVECPTCGTEHENSFVQRFELAQNESDIIETLNELHEENSNLDKKVWKLKKSLNNNQIELDEINSLLTKTKKQIRLNDIIENEGKKLMKDKFAKELAEIEVKMTTFSLDLHRKEENIKALKNPARIKEIKKNYTTLMRNFLKLLKVYEPDEKDYKELNIQIINNEIGNNVPRMLLSYFFSFFHIMDKYSSTVYCPIVIDSPNQQAPDKENLKNIIGFIFKNLPKKSQAIIALEDTMEVGYKGESIILQKGRGLLREELFQKVFKKVEPIIIAVNSNRKTSLF